MLNENADNSISDDLIVKMLTWEKTPIILEGWQFKIIQMTLREKYRSRFRTAELRLLRKLLSDKGFE